MKFKQMKKGELTTQQIVIIIILIASFLVILFLIFRLNFGSQTKDQLCRNSVLLKGNSALPSASTSLNCYRSYECITSSNSCVGLSNPDKIINAKNITNIYDTLAQNMANCWWEFGEGKVNYVGGDVSHNNYCSICYQIVLDPSLNNIVGVTNGQVDLDGFYNYMSTAVMPGSTSTYLQYLFGTNDLAGLKKSISTDANNPEGIGTFGQIQTGQQYFIVMGITSQISAWKWAGIGGAAGAGTTALGITVTALTLATPPGWVVGGAIFIGGAIGAGIGAASGSSIANSPTILALTTPGKGVPNNFTSPTILQVDSQKFKALNCENILTYS